MKTTTTISRKAAHAIDLCTLLARRQRRGCSTTTQLAAALGLTVSYVEKIIKPLKEGDVVSALKGPGGGYMIRGDAAGISMWDIASLFESAGDADEAAEGKRHPPAAYELALAQIIENTLRGFSLSDFVDDSAQDVASDAYETGRFKFKPLAVPFVPKAPNSVFQLSMAL